MFKAGDGLWCGLSEGNTLFQTKCLVFKILEEIICYDKNIKRNEPKRLIYRVLLPFLKSQEGTLIAFGLYDFATHL
jgi:hypothetical protein